MYMGNGELRFFTWDLELRTWNMKAEIWNLELGTCNLSEESKIWDLKLFNFEPGAENLVNLEL